MGEHLRPECCGARQVVAVLAGPLYREPLRFWSEQVARCEAFDLERPAGLPPVLIQADGVLVNGNHRAYVAAEMGLRLWGLVVVRLADRWGAGGPLPWVATGEVVQVLPAVVLPAAGDVFE